MKLSFKNFVDFFKFSAQNYPRMSLGGPRMDPNELPWTWVGPRLTWVDPGKPGKNPGKTWVGPGLDLGLACVTRFKPVGARFKPVGARFKPVGPIGLKRALRFTLARHHLLSLFKPIGVYPLLPIGGDRLLRDKEYGSTAVHFFLFQNALEIR